ncbi:outer membrane beta-barrel protein [Niabella beijingensis]|uniref:outer membrane beta-barrel protein n=1 Tax=Niabella beijingensis TaxID=2872700 RepID=UPI001CBE0112|nr:outer membrane beta-barrel protein [Niabella beijingensis]MBZ4189924.1 PorT family protein [Niabella beijingensis]
MKKIVLFLAACFLLGGALHAQVDTSASATAAAAAMAATPPKTPKKKYDLTKRANDHFLVQLGYTNWTSLPDSIQTGNFPRSINAYFMLDFPFKSNQKLSAAIGLGVGSDHMSLDKDVNLVNVKSTGTRLPFNDTTRLDAKKTKLGTTYLEVPLELRFVSDPEHSDKSFKIALGVKAGTMIKAATRTRVVQSGGDYLLKESSKRYFNTTRIVGTARIGVGHFTLFGTYQFTKLLKDGAGPEIKPYTIGLSFGGL